MLHQDSAIYPRVDQRRERTGRVGRGLRQGFPRQAAVALENRIATLATFVRKQIRSELLPSLDGRTEGGAFERMERAIEAQFPDDQIEKQLRRVAERRSREHGKQFFASLSSATGLDIVNVNLGEEMSLDHMDQVRTARRRVAIFDTTALAIEGFLTESLTLIKGIKEETIPIMRDSIIQARAFGETPEQLAQRWIDRGIPTRNGTLEGRAKVIANDQMGKLQGKLTEIRQTTAGVTSYFWRSMDDDDVRDTHQDFDDNEFKWATGSPEGHPGEPINCRCHAEAIINTDDILSSGNTILL